MLASPHTNSWGFIYTNQANGIDSPLGTSVIPGASSVEGDWTEIAGDANITTDIQYVSLLVNNGLTASNAKNHFLDFGWDPAGGTSYVSFFEDLVCGATGAATTPGAGKPFHFPCKIPAGSAVAVRVQGSNATAGTVGVLAHFYGKPSRPELWRPAAYAETLGAGASTLGTTFTPGTDDWGAWASLGSPSKKHFWAQAGVQVNNGTCILDGTHCQLAIGDGTNMHVISDFWHGSNTGEQQFQSPQFACTWEIPASSTLYIRGNNSGAPASGYNATAVLFGG